MSNVVSVTQDITCSITRDIEDVRYYAPIDGGDGGDGGGEDDGNLASTNVADWVAARGNSTLTQSGSSIVSTADSISTFGASTPVELETGKTYAISLAVEKTDVGGSSFSRLSENSALSAGNQFSRQDDALYETTLSVGSTGTYHIGVVATSPGASGSLLITASVTEVI